MKLFTSIRTVAFATILSTNLSVAKAQCTAPAMTFVAPALTKGDAGTKGAEYTFLNVTPGVNAIFTVTDIVGGAKLTSMDDLTYGYSAAWQPVVKTPSNQGAGESYVSFKIEFVNTIGGGSYQYDCAQLSFIDVDGDGSHVREFVAARGYDSYTVANNTILTLTNTNSGGSGTLTKAAGTYGTYNGLDTSAYITNINFNYKNVKKIDEVRVGNITDNSFTVQDRYSCGYFKNITIPNISILPVTYTSFNGTVVDNKSVNLNWITAQEINNNYFEVERSFDNSNFKLVGMVLDGFATTGGQKSYMFKDNAADLVGKSVVYYRLKQVDMDGKGSYSKVVAVKFQAEANNNNDVQVSPNPFTANLYVRFNATENGNAEIRIISVAGVKMVSKQSTIVKGYNNILVEGLSKLAPGLYIAQLVQNGVVIDNKKVIRN